MGEIARYTVEVADFVEGVPLLGSVDAVSILFSQLAQHTATEGLTTRFGRIISYADVSEAGLFVDASATEGAVISVRCARIPTSITLVVARSSRLLRGFVWSVLGLGLIAGVVAAKFLLPTSWDPEPRLGLGVLGGVGLAVVVFYTLRNASWLASGRSEELARRLDRSVQDWLAGLVLTEPKKKGKRKRARLTGGE